MEEEKKNELLVQMHLRIFCVGIRQIDSSKQILEKRYVFGKSIFQTFMDSELLEFVPIAMEKFNEIVYPKEELLEKDENLEENLFFEAVSEVRSKMCENQPQNDEKQEQQTNKTINFS